ncbi:MFS transporter [Aestuariicella hydrocarbonica]|uniref:MFS transporter n=1 Tax=Pseudomaricurvus hydrocarbonicus TaxID=1470433 RepID=A0A9E5JWA1_9GAMM|nr:MFS transporter [Aestuariicella hydrocarbonica]NHO65700.1 MFS transporter [Aestuariicella hydrocarbonica]
MSGMSPAQLSPYPAPSVAWRATIILSLLYWLSILDRFIIALLVDPIKRDLGLTDMQFGLLQGVAFTITFAAFGLLAGALADRFSRRWIIFASVSIWSLATAACGLAQNFFQLLFARVGVGAGEAGLNPNANSMLADLFPRDRLTSAMAVYTIGATIGSGMAYLLGGMIVDLVSNSNPIALPYIGELRPWQSVFLIVGIPGAFMSLLIFTIPEPVRRGKLSTAEAAKRKHLLSSYAELLKFMRPRWKFFTCHYMGFAIASIVLTSGAMWYPAHMGRSFGWDASTIGLNLGLTLIVAGVTGKLLSGFIMDTMYRRGYRDAQLRWYTGCLLVAAPIGILATTSDNPWVFLGGIGVFLILLAPLPACYSTALNLVTPNQLRGTGIAFFAVTGGLIGMAAGPIVVAAISDYLFGSNLGMAMAATIGVCSPLAALFLFLGCRPMREAVNEAESWSGNPVTVN